MWQFISVVLIAILLFYGILISEIPGMWKFFLGVGEMIIVGQIFIQKFNMSGEMGMVLLRSKLGLKAINDFAKDEGMWKFFADVGSTMAYGLMSFYLMRKNVSLKSIVCGIVMLLVLSYIVAPEVAPFLSNVLKIGTIEKAKESLPAATSGPWMLIFGFIFLMAGGFFFLLLFSILLYGVIVLSAFFSTLLSGTSAISNISPGGTLLLPGINLPFFEGIAALVIIMAVHEGAHAILSRIAKVPVLSSGIVLFGILPIGAFVEPDEKKLAKTDRVAQTRVLVAGSTANLFASILFFLLFVLFSILISKTGWDSIPILSSVLYFIYLVLGMAFALNFVVGSVNLLPLPFFDGYKILEINVENKMIVKGLMILTLIAFLVNFLPWFFAK